MKLTALLNSVSIIFIGLASMFLSGRVDKLESRTCPNCHLKDSLYQKCNGIIHRANGDSLMNTKSVMR